VPALLPLDGEPVDALADGQAHANGPQGGIGALHWIVEEHHEPVACEVLQGSLELEDQVANGLVVLPQRPHDVLGLGRLGEGREAAKVAEGDGDIPAVGLEGILARGDDRLGDLGR
jgi:hypothetical protein